MRGAGTKLTPLFLLSFLFIVILTAMNMFIAILSEYYTYAKKQREEQRDAYRNKKSHYSISSQSRLACCTLRTYV